MEGLYIKCMYLDQCKHKKTHKCATCKNNSLRNRELDCYEPANDKPIPEECPRLTYSGPAEHTAGYQCPVCGTFTNPYALDADKRCEGCGYKLNVG